MLHRAHFLGKCLRRITVAHRHALLLQLKLFDLVFDPLPQHIIMCLLLALGGLCDENGCPVYDDQKDPSYGIRRTGELRSSIPAGNFERISTTVPTGTEKSWKNGKNGRFVHEHELPNEPFYAKIHLKNEWNETCIWGT